MSKHLLSTVFAAAAAAVTPLHAEAPFDAAGHVYEARFSADTRFELDFTEPGQMTYVSLAGSGKGAHETVRYTARRIRPHLFMVYWSEASGRRVVHVEDFAEGHVWTNIAIPNGDFLHLDGELKKIR